MARHWPPSPEPWAEHTLATRWPSATATSKRAAGHAHLIEKRLVFRAAFFRLDTRTPATHNPRLGSDLEPTLDTSSNAPISRRASRAPSSHTARSLPALSLAASTQVRPFASTVSSRQICAKRPTSPKFPRSIAIISASRPDSQSTALGFAPAANHPSNSSVVPSLAALSSPSSIHLGSLDRPDASPCF